MPKHPKYPLLPHGVFGWDSAKLAGAYTVKELAAASLAITADPANPAHAAGTSIWLYTKSAMRKTDALSWAIRHIQAEKKRSDT